MTNSKKHQAHGLTIEQMEELRNQRTLGNYPMIPANNASDIKNKLFVHYEDHEILEVEKGGYHIAMELPSFHSTTGEKQSKSSIKRFTKDAFEFQKKQRGFEGYELHILHDPTKIVASSTQPVDTGLTGLQGVGSAKAKKLAKNGIKTVKELSELPEDTILKLVAEGIFEEVELLSWIDQAKG